MHPSSRRSVFHLASSVGLGRLPAEPAAFSRATGAGPRKQIMLVLDWAGWHASRKLPVPKHDHLLFLPPYSPKLNPAEYLWPLTDTGVAHRHFATVAELEGAQAARGLELQHIKSG